ncbi:MAG: TIGR03546 family protein [Spirochaetota bacterium]
MGILAIIGAPEELMIVRMIAKLLALLNSNSRAVEVGAALALGLWLALMPAANLLFAALVVLVFLVKVNLGMTIASFLVLSLVAPALDPVLDAIGFRILTAPALEDLYTTVYAQPVVPLTRFNDTLVAGAFVSGAALFVPVTALGVVLVRLYRKYIHAKIADSKLVKAVMATPFAQKVAAAVRGVRRVWPTAA